MFPNKKESLVLTLSLLFVQIAIGIYLGSIGITWEAGNPVIYIFLSIVSTFLIVWFSLNRMDLKFVQLFHANTSSVLSVLVITALPLAMIAIGGQIILSNFFNLYFSFFPNETEVTKGITALAHNGTLGVVSICIVAPIVEEIVFRGIMLRGLLSSYSTAQAIFFSSILFSLYHFNIDQLFHTFLFGIFFGWLYTKTYSLWPSIIAHMLFNIIAFILGISVIELEGVNYFPNDEIVYPFAMLQVLSIGSLLVGFYILSSLFNKN